MKKNLIIIIFVFISFFIVSCSNNSVVKNQIERTFELTFESKNYVIGYYDDIEYTGIQEVDRLRENGRLKFVKEVEYIDYLTYVKINISYDYATKTLRLNENGKVTTINNAYLSDRTIYKDNKIVCGYEYFVYQKINDDINFIKVIWFNDNCSGGYIINIIEKPNNI